MIAGRDALVRALLHPGDVRRLSLEAWDVLIRQGRAAQLLGRLHARLAASGFIDTVPEAPRRHLESAGIMAERQRQAVLHEVDAIARALAATRVPVVFLKGAAYILADVEAARGRTLSDIDLMVPKARLPDVEAGLMLAGFATTDRDPYDQRYYRQWMHEIPPMRHIKRGTTLDVHHAILPGTARVRADSDAMREAAVPIGPAPNVRVFTNVDMVLHSATHLFHEGELDKGLRDLLDLDSLLREFSARNPGFWEELLERAQKVGLGRPLFYALRNATRIAGTPVPPASLARAEAGGPAAPVRTLMDALYARALRPHHATTSDALTPLALWLLYLRGHWLRMPLPLLALHLSRKALRREPAKEAER